MLDALAKLIQHKPESTSVPHLIVGLGNPGREYRESRHNAGFMVIDLLSQTFGFGLSRLQSKALVGQGDVEGKRVILAKPQTFMNLSGQSVGPLVRFYKIPLENLLVIYDDMDLPLGTVRIRPSGGSAGQKGLASVIERLGTQDFPRVRIGIGRPNGRMDARDYVLDDFNRGDKELFNQVLERVRDAVQIYLREGLETAMNRCNGPLEKG